MNILFYKESLVAMEAVSKVLCYNVFSANIYIYIKKRSHIFGLKLITQKFKKKINISLKGWRIRKSGKSMLPIRKRQSVTMERGDR